MRTKLLWMSLALTLFACGQKAKSQPQKTPPVSTPAPTPETKPATSQPAAASSSAPASVAATAPASVAAPVEFLVELQVKEAPPQPASDAPRSNISLIITETGKPPVSKDLGDYNGCGVITADIDPTALLSISCFWAGAGDTFNVYQQPTAIVVRYLATDEEMEGKPVPQIKFGFPLPTGAVVKTVP